MHYYDMVGDYLTAYAFCLSNGGQLYPGNGKDSASVVVIGQKCYTFWKKDSKRRLEVYQLADFFSLPHEGQTGGRICRWLINDLLDIPYKDTFWSKTYKELAKDGKHWHYLYSLNKQPYWGVEIDIKSAYFASLLNGRSLLFSSKLGYLEDNNALENLRKLIPSLPKWFRLQLLGLIASWRCYFYTKDKQNPTSNELIMKRRFHIGYGAAFNAVHRAILRNYKIMQKIHEIGGEYIKRIHTDGFIMDAHIPENTENTIFQYIADKGLEYSVKGAGRCFFWDVNTGFVGNKFVGAPIDLAELMRKDNIKMASKEKNAEVLLRQGAFSIKEEKELHNSLIPYLENTQSYEQLRLKIDLSPPLY